MIGSRIGNYRVARKLAEGGMGEVYVVHHELMDREAVVKVLLPEMSTQKEIVKRFFNEARAATSIHHPGIVEVFDVGYMEDGRAYIVMEKLRGAPLATRLEQHKLTIAQAVSITRQLAGALGAAHERGIVHRDLKPDNLFLVPDPEVAGNERVKVLDFGIAKLAVDKPGSLMTAVGAIFGTPAYMAPEQCTSAASVDQRADLYAVGCILYQLTCGQPPFGQGGIELLAAHLRDPVVPPSSRNPAVPPYLDAIALRLLEKRPERRFQSCAELIAALDVGAASVAHVAADGVARSAINDTAVLASDGPIGRAITTHSSAAGEHRAPHPTVGRARTIMFVAAAGAVAVIAGSLALWSRDRDRETDPGRPVDPVATVAPAPAAPDAAATTPSPVPASPVAAPPSLVVGERVLVQRGPLDFAIHELQAFKNGIALVDEREVDAAGVRPIVVAAAWEQGDGMVFQQGGRLRVGIVEHVRIDGQLTVRVLGDAASATLTFSPPKAMRQGHHPLTAAHLLPDDWTAAAVADVERVAAESATRAGEAAAEAAEREADERERKAVVQRRRSAVRSKTYRACYRHCHDEMQGSEAYCVPHCEAEATR